MNDSGSRIELLTLPSIRFYLAAPHLRDFITSYYVIETAGPLADHLHPEWANIRFSLSGRWTAENLTGADETPFGSALFGPTDRTRRFVTEGGVVLGVGLSPLGWVKMIDQDASTLANAFVELGDMLGPAGDDIAERLRNCADDHVRCGLLDEILSSRASRQTADEHLASKAQSLILAGEGESIASFTAAMGLAYRPLSRLCLRVFGFGPKRLFRRQRFLRTLAQIRDRLDQPLGSMLDPAYYDQAHFIRDFRAYMGVTPTAYFNSPREIMRRAADERVKAIGAPFQALHRKS